MWKKMQTDMEESANKLDFIASNFVIYPQIWILSVFKIASFPHVLNANKTFHVTVLLFVYFCDQFVAAEIRHSRRHCSVCQQYQHGIQRR